MDEHIRSLAEAVLVTTDEGGGGFMFPIIDVLDKVGLALLAVRSRLTVEHPGVIILDPRPALEAKVFPCP